MSKSFEILSFLHPFPSEFSSYFVNLIGSFSVWAGMAAARGRWNHLNVFAH
jgi:hypothetical protein